MITDEKSMEIIEGLLAKSRANQVNWRLKYPDHVNDINLANSFVVYLPQSSVEIDFQSPSAEPDQFVISFFNKNGIAVKRLVVDEEHPSWPTVYSLFDEAGRFTVGWDKVFDDLENAVKSNDSIGNTPTR